MKNTIEFKGKTELDLVEVKSENQKLRKALRLMLEAGEKYGAIACPLPSQLGDNEEIEEMSDMDNAPYCRGGKLARKNTTLAKEALGKELLKEVKNG